MNSHSRKLYVYTFFFKFGVQLLLNPTGLMLNQILSSVFTVTLAVCIVFESDFIKDLRRCKVLRPREETGPRDGQQQQAPQLAPHIIQGHVTRISWITMIPMIQERRDRQDPTSSQAITRIYKEHGFYLLYLVFDSFQLSTLVYIRSIDFSTL